MHQNFYLKNIEIVFCIIVIISIVLVLNMVLYALVEIIRIRKTDKNKANRWIPIKERLPSCHGLFIVTVAADENYSEQTTALYYDCCSDKWYLSLDTIDYTYDVIAWQPLPEPYQGGGT